MTKLAIRATVAVVVATALLTGVVRTSSAMTPEEAECRKAILKGVANYVKTAGKLIASCHKGRDKGKLPSVTDCNDLSVADLKSKLPAKENAFHATVGGSADLCALAAPVLAAYPSCKSPAETADDAGATTGIDTFSELADCEIALARELVESSARQVLGHPDPAAMSADAVQCHSSVALRYTKAMDVYVKERGRCQATLDKAGGPIDYACDGQDSSQRIAKAVTKLNDTISSRCSTLTLEEADAMGSCGDTAGQLQGCVTGTVVTRIGSGLASMVYGLSVCPRGVNLTLHAGVGSMITTTEVDLGSTGLFHDQDVGDGGQLAVTLDCNPLTCANCSVTLDLTAGNCRCQSDSIVQCSTINGSDLACGGGLCNCYFFPPQPINGGGLPLCLVQKMNSEFNGIASAASGQSSTNVDLSTVVYLGIGSSQPCPTCDAGVCDGGARNGLACSVDAEHCTYGDLSYDCLPSPASNISGIGLQIDLNPLTDGAVSLATGTCGGAIDACVGSCIPDTGWDYQCDLSGPQDSYCDGALTCSGGGYIPCAVTADCVATAASCPGGNCGACTIADTRDCPSDPLTAAGSAAVASSSGGPFQGELVSTFCIPTTSSASVNTVAGFPGPGRLRYHLGYDPKCGTCTLNPTLACSIDTDCSAVSAGSCVANSTSWNPPNGSNCP